MYPYNPLSTRHDGIIGHFSLLSTVDPIDTGGHEDPLPGETGHLHSTSPLYFPSFPLVTVHLFPFAFAPFPSFSFGVLYLLPSFLGMA